MALPEGELMQQCCLVRSLALCRSHRNSLTT